LNFELQNSKFEKYFVRVTNLDGADLALGSVDLGVVLLLAALCVIYIHAVHSKHPDLR
jgi:hypothetical protein